MREEGEGIAEAQGGVNDFVRAIGEGDGEPLEGGRRSNDEGYEGGGIDAVAFEAEIKLDEGGERGRKGREEEVAGLVGVGGGDTEGRKGEGSMERVSRGQALQPNVFEGGLE